MRKKRTHIVQDKKKSYLDLVDDESRGKGLSKLGSLCLILDNKSIKILGTSNLELDGIGVLLDASGYLEEKIQCQYCVPFLRVAINLLTGGVLSTGNLEELLNILNLLRL